MSDLFQDVFDFHEKFKLVEKFRKTPGFLDRITQAYRDNFLEEEYLEYKSAVAEGDLPKAIDALIDMVYVILGTAAFMGVKFNHHWDLVNDANMAKERVERPDPDPRSTRQHTFDVVKPEGWTPPDHETLLRSYSNDAT